MKTVAIIQARMGSTRFPGKVMRKLNGHPVLRWVINAATAVVSIDEVWVATTEEERDDIIVEYCNQNHVDVWRGPETDVLKRVHDCAKAAKANIVVRLTADCPFHDPAVIDEVVMLRRRGDYAYASNVDPPTWPDGLDVECFTAKALEIANFEAILPSDRDCYTQFIQRNRDRFTNANLHCPIPGLQNERWVLDTEEDFRFCQEIAQANSSSYRDIVSFLDERPELRKINEKWTRNERFYDQRAHEELGGRSYLTSDALYIEALNVQPYGGSTYSKTAVAYGRYAPLYATHGDGGTIYDCDGNSYVDFVGGLGAVILGYRHPTVDGAIRAQLDRGISFSLSTELETRVCERLAGLQAGDNMVVLGKNGSDVTTAALRIARAHTNRNITLSGAGSYHGWHDWALAGDKMRGHGIPEEGGWHWKEYESNIQLDERVAAVIVEPDRWEGWQLRKLREQCNQWGSLLIFDEVFTGLRYPDLLVSRFHHVHPDLTCMGKALGNGMPISALIGSRHIMERFAPGKQPNAFYSTTMGGECLSLAACLATLDVLQDGGNKKMMPTCDYIDVLVRDMVQHYNLQKQIIQTGAPLNRLTFEMGGPELANCFRYEMAQAGVLVYSSFNVMVAHSEPDLDRLETALDQTLRKISKGEAKGYELIPNTIMRR